MSDDELWEEPFPDDEDETEPEIDEGRWESPVFEDESLPDEIPPELLVSLDAHEDEAEEDLAELDHYDTQHSDGHTYDVSVANDQGLTYTPPTDPPVMPSLDDPEGIDIAAGFGLSMEDQDSGVEILPEEVDDNDLDLEEDVYEAIRFNSETQNLTGVRVRAANGVVALFGTVPDDQDMERLVDLIEDMRAVRRVVNRLVVEEDEGYEE